MQKLVIMFKLECLQNSLGLMSHRVRVKNEELEKGMQNIHIEKMYINNNSNKKMKIQPQTTIKVKKACKKFLLSGEF
jgi:hypothetical protein